MWNKVKEYVNNIKKAAKNNLPSLIIIISFILLTPEGCIKFALLSTENESVKDGLAFLSYIGSTMLVTGVYGVFSKTLFFKDIYSSMITDVFYGTDNLKRKTEQELESIWRRVSECMYKAKRFSEINEAVEKHILSSYLPSKQPYYFKNNKTVIEYSWDTENEGYLIVTEDVFFSVVGIESEYTGPVYKFTSYIDKQEDDKIPYVKVLEYVVDGEKIQLSDSNQLGNQSENDISLSCSTSEMGKNITKIYTLCIDKFNGVEHSIHYKTEQRVELYCNKLKSSLCKRIVDGWDVTIHYPKNLKVEFMEIGLLKDFDVICENDGLMCLRHEDLVFPYQGYLIFVDTLDTK